MFVDENDLRKIKKLRRSGNKAAKCGGVESMLKSLLGERSKLQQPFEMSPFPPLRKVRKSENPNRKCNPFPTKRQQPTALSYKRRNYILNFIRIARGLFPFRWRWRQSLIAIADNLQLLFAEMNFTKAELAFLDNEISNRTRQVLNNFQDHSDILIEIESNELGIPKYQVYSRLLKTCAKDLIDTRTDGLIEVCRKFNKFPDQELRTWFFDNTIVYAAGISSLFGEYQRRFTSEDIPEYLAIKIQSSILSEIENDIFPLGLKPLTKFCLEGAVMRKEMAEIESLERNKPASLVEHYLSKDAEIYLRKLYEYQKRGEEISDKKILVELSKETGHYFERPTILKDFLLNGKITVVGLALIDPGCALVVNTNRVLAAIRGILSENADLPTITSESIAEKSKLSLSIVENSLRELENYRGKFHHSGVMAANNGRSVMNLDGHSFDDYMKYETLESILEHEGQRKDSKMPAKSTPAIHVEGDYVVGNQIKGDNIGGIQNSAASLTLQTIKHQDTTGWSRNDKIGLAAIIVAVIIGMTALAVPNIRSLVCNNIGYLCDQHQSQ